MMHFDPQLLQTLLAFAETGSLAQAAQIAGRSPSAITAQIQRLEDAAGTALLRTSGRGRVLTPAGEQLVFHARHILAAQREAWLSVHGEAAQGRIAIGLTQDFTGAPLPGILNQFARTHPDMRLDMRVGRSAELEQLYQARKLDLLIAVRGAVAPDEISVFAEDMLWIGAAGGLAHAPGGRLPLALLDRPCLFRNAAIRSLEGQNRPFRIVSSSSHLAGIEPAVRAGIALTVRTARFQADGLGPAGPALDLPPLPRAEFSIRLHGQADEPARHMAAIIADCIGHQI